MKLTGTERFVLTIGWVVVVGLGLLATYQEVIDLGLNIDHKSGDVVVKVALPNLINSAWFGGAALLMGFGLFGYQTPARGKTWGERAASEWSTTVKVALSFAAASFICAGILHKPETAISLLIIGLMCAVAQFAVSMGSALYYDAKRRGQELPEGVTPISAAKDKANEDQAA